MKRFRPYALTILIALSACSSPTTNQPADPVLDEEDLDPIGMYRGTAVGRSTGLTLLQAQILQNNEANLYQGLFTMNGTQLPEYTCKFEAGSDWIFDCSGDWGVFSGRLSENDWQGEYLERTYDGLIPGSFTLQKE